MAEAQKFRETLLQIVPRWLRTGEAARVLYAIGLHIDAFAEWAINAVRLRYPGAPNTLPDTLPHIGRERRIIRGAKESDSQYSQRLIDWLNHHKVRANPYAFLRAFHAYFQDYVVTTSGAGADTVDGGALTVELPTPPRKGALLVVQFYEFSGATYDPLEGFSLLHIQTLGNGDKQSLYVRISDGTEVETAFSDLAVSQRARAYRIEGQFTSLDQVQVIQAYIGSGTSVPQPSVAAPGLVRFAFVGYASSATIGAFGGWTEEGGGEFVSGAAGIQAQRHSPDDPAVAGAATLSTSSVFGAIVISVSPAVGAVKFGVASVGATRCVELIYRGSNSVALRYSMAVNGAITRDHVGGVGSGVWLEPPYKSGICTWWLVLHVTPPANDGEWDDPGTWDDGGLWDTSMTQAAYEDYKLVPNAENAGHAVGYLALIGNAEITAFGHIWEDPDAAFANGVLLLPLTRGVRF